MSDFAANWFVLVAVFSLALISPGPDFVIAVRNSVSYSRRSGIVTAVGFGLGVGVHVLYCLAGLALVISKSLLAFNAIKMIGAAYLFYVGIMSLRSKGFSDFAVGQNATAKHMSDVVALRSGFITNLFNPKATLFFLALFTQIIKPDGEMIHRIIYGVTCVIMTMLWFSLVATILTTPAIKSRFLKASKWIDRLCGVALIALGLRLALTKLPS